VATLYGGMIMVPSGGGTPLTLVAASWDDYAYQVVVDTVGNVYAAFLSSSRIINTIKKFKPIGGYYISPALPAGLSFNNATGVISGNPISSSLATNYTITAYNANGIMSSAIVNISVSGLPVFNYNGPNTYSRGIAITPLAATSTGVATPGYSDNTVDLGSEFTSPFSVATDAPGNVYVADNITRTISKVPAGGGAPVIINSSSGPSSFNRSIAADAAGNVYYAQSGKVMKIPAGGGADVILGSGFSQVQGITVDVFGNIYVSDYGNNEIKKIPVSGGPIVILASGIAPYGIAADAAGNVYFGNASENADLKEIPAGGGPIVTLRSHLTDPNSIAVDPSGNLYVAMPGTGVIMLPAGGGTPLNLASSGVKCYGVAVDTVGNLFIAIQGSSTVKELKPIGGYYISPALPAGLNFNNTTGVISGTPTAGSPATNYTIRAYNSNGGNSAPVNIAVAIQPAISYAGPQTYTVGTVINPLLPLSIGVAAPGYGNKNVSLYLPGFSSYQDNIATDPAGNLYIYDAGNRFIKKIPVGNSAPVTVFYSRDYIYGGFAVDAAGNIYIGDGVLGVMKIPVNGGAPVILSPKFSYVLAVDDSGNVFVTDQVSGLVKKIPVGGGAAVALDHRFSSPKSAAFDSQGNVYVAAAYSVAKIAVEGGAIVQFPYGYFISPNSVAVDASGNVFVADIEYGLTEIPAATGIPVKIGSNGSRPYYVAVDGAGNVYVTYKQYSSMGVDVIKPTGGFYISPFLPAGLSFNNATGAISGTPKVSHAATNYTITAYNILGVSGSTMVNIKVNSNDATLANLTVSAGTLTPAFTTATTSFTAAVSNTTTSVTVTPVTTDTGAGVKVNGTTVASGTSSGSISLVVGDNTITTEITAEDGVTIGTYTLTVNRASGGLGVTRAIASLNNNGTAVPGFNDGLVVHPALSPNGDGMNDVFTIDGINAFPDNKVTIINRSGTVVYEAKGYDNSNRAFDGHSSINGKMQLPGSYFYLLEYRAGADVKRITGYIIIKN
jgi:gliding motility-associated-like protein